MERDTRAKPDDTAQSDAVLVKSLSEVVTERLREGILSGEFHDGEYLRQQTLAARFGVSEGVVREALRRLETEGLVRIEQRRGAKVSELSVAEITELYELRILLEEMLARHAAPHTSAEVVAHAAQLMDLMGTESDPIRWLELNRDFHNTLYRPSNLPRFLRFANELRVIVERYLRLTLTIMRTALVVEDEHRKMLDAFRSKDGDLAAQQVAAHLRGTRERLVVFLNSRRLPAPDGTGPSRSRPVTQGQR